MEALARLAARRPVGVTVIALVCVVLGVISWRQLPLDLFPDIQSPTVLISVNAGDRPPLEMERLYGERLEQQLFTVHGMRSIEQVARTGRLVARVNFEWDVDIDYALVEVTKAMAPINADPQVDEVIVRRFDPRQLPTLTLGLIARGGQPDLAELRRIAERQIAPAMQELEGVAEVRVTGGRQEEVQVQLDRTRMEAHGITLADVEARIRATNVNLSAGTLEEDNLVYLIRGVSRFANAADVGDVVLRYETTALGRHTPVRVADIAAVQTGHAEIRHLVRVDGREGVGLAIYKEAGANTVTVSRVVRDAIQAMRADLPGVEVRLITDEAALVEDSIADLESSALLGILLSIAVLVAYLRSAGPVLVVAAAVPVSLFAAVFAMHYAGYSLNLMTLGGLALGAGMVVNNAIVVIESIFRCRFEGQAPAAAAARGAGIVGGAIISSTLTTCVVFVPVLFVQGMAARLASGIAFTVVLSLLASLAAAVLLVPALATWLLPNQPPININPGATRLESLVTKLLRRPMRVIGVALSLIVISVYALASLGTELLPPSDPRQFDMRVVTAPGQRVQATANVVATIEQILSAAADGQLEAILSEVGRLPDDDRVIRENQTEENTAEIHVRLARGDLTAGSVTRRAEAAIDKLYGVEASWGAGTNALASALGVAGPPITIEIEGESLDGLRRAAALLTKQLATLPELWNVRSSFEGGPPEYRLRLDQASADANGVDLELLSQVLEAALDGKPVTTLTLGDEEQEVVLYLPARDRSDLLALTFQTPDGRHLSVGDVASIERVAGAQEIFRRNQRRTAQVTAQVRPKVELPNARAAVATILQDAKLPSGLTARLAGEEMERLQTVSQLKWAGALALLLVLMVLAATFESLLHPITVLASIPIAAIGVALLLVPLGQPVDIVAMLGIIVLAGIAVNDSILITEFARQLHNQGLDLPTALARAAVLRLRPIVMTTATTVLALVPLALSAGEAAALRRPMALTIIGGITVSTIGSLTVIPCIYLVLEGLRNKAAAALGSWRLTAKR